MRPESTLRAGTALDAVPGSALEAAIGPQNLRQPAAAELEGGDMVLDRSALAN